MFNVKWGLIAGLVGLVLALLTSLVFARVSLPVALLRALIFAVVFCGLGGGISALINFFIPDLLSSGARGGDIADNVFSAELSGSAGSRVNISLDDDTPNAALPNTDTPRPEEVGDFNDLVTGSIKALRDIDQKPSGGYTEETEQFAPAFESVNLGNLGDFSLDFGAFVSEGGETGDADSDMDLFSFLPDNSNSGRAEEIPPPERKVAGNKTTEFKGDFDPKEIAAGIRTVLQKDKG